MRWPQFRLLWESFSSITNAKVTIGNSWTTEGLLLYCHKRNFRRYWKTILPKLNFISMTLIAQYNWYWKYFWYSPSNCIVTPIEKKLTNYRMLNLNNFLNNPFLVRHHNNFKFEVKAFLFHAPYSVRRSLFVLQYHCSVLIFLRIYIHTNITAAQMCEKSAIHFRLKTNFIPFRGMQLK